MESILFTEKFLEKFFNDNFIEDDSLFECLKNRKGTIEIDPNKDYFDDDVYKGEEDEQNNFALTIRLKMREL